MERATESGLEVEAPTGLQVAPQPDENKYYIGDGGSNHPLFVPPDQSNQSQVKSPGRSRAIWILVIITVVCLALAVGGGLGGGLHKSSLSRSPHLLLLVSLSSAFSNTYFFSLPSHASTASTEASNASPPQKSSPPTSTPSSIPPAISSASPLPPPLPSTTPAPPNPSQISSNNKGSLLCFSINDATCRIAYSQYNDTYLYKARTSYILPSGVNSVANDLFSSADDGCAAEFACQSDADFAVGMTGAQIKAVFENLYQNDNVDICGTSYLSNGCHVTANVCVNCEPAVPCGSLSAENIANKYPCYT